VHYWWLFVIQCYTNAQSYEMSAYCIGIMHYACQRRTNSLCEGRRAELANIFSGYFMKCVNIGQCYENLYTTCNGMDTIASTLQIEWFIITANFIINTCTFSPNKFSMKKNSSEKFEIVKCYLQKRNTSLNICYVVLFWNNILTLL
jgi:hypothetical protein